MPASTREATRGSTEARDVTVAGSDGRLGSQEAEPLKGGVQIAESVLAKIAARAARAVPGIYPAGAGGVARALGTSQAQTEGIRARIRHGRDVDLDMKMKVDYGEHIPTRGEQVRRVVAASIDRLTDLQTREIKVKITEIAIPENEGSANGADADGVDAGS